MRQGPPDATASRARIPQPRPTQEYGTYSRFRRRSVTADAELFDMPRVARGAPSSYRNAGRGDGARRCARGNGHGGAAIGKADLAPAAAVVTVLLVGVLGGYRPSDSMTADGMSELRNLGLAAILATWLVTLVDLVLGENVSAAGSIAMVCVLACGLVAVRALLRLRRPAQRERVVVIGSGRTARRIMDLASRHPERRFQVVGVLHDGPGKSFGSDPPLVGRVSRLPALLSRGEVDRVVVALGTADDAAVLRVLRKCDPFGVPVDVLPRFFELIGHARGGTASAPPRC